MMLFLTLFISLQTFLVLAYIARRQKAAGKYAAVPVKKSAFVIAGLAVAALAGGFFVSNIQANNAASERRGLVTLMAIGMAKEPETPVGDIAAGLDEAEVPQMRIDLGAGKEVAMKTRSGKPASVRLYGAGPGRVQPFITYDGKLIEPGPSPFNESIFNDSGYPQLIPLPPLEERLEKHLNATDTAKAG